ncbi:MAG: hypothetical protein K2H76_09785 [Muribaculaceae bacterium]|nr:hypothetical protein [Muribaculaceae bacterium]
MKRIMFILSFVLMATSIAMGGEIVKELNLHYDLKDFKVKENDGMVILKANPFNNMIENLVTEFNQAALPKFLYWIYRGDYDDEYDIE